MIKLPGLISNNILCDLTQFFFNSSHTEHNTRKLYYIGVECVATVVMDI